MTLQSYNRFNLLYLRSFLENVLVVFALDICRFCQCLATYWVHPILEYGSSVRDPYTDKLQEELEKVQNRAARFVTRNYVNWQYDWHPWTIEMGIPLEKQKG